MVHLLTDTRSKYSNRKVERDGFVFDSQLEADEYTRLRLAEKDGRYLRDLRVHPVFVLEEGFRDASGTWQRPIIYEGDFSYVEIETGRTVVVDTKGVMTRVASMKLKFFKARYPAIELVIVKKGNRRR